MARAKDWDPFARDAPCGPLNTFPCEPSHHLTTERSAHRTTHLFGTKATRHFAICEASTQKWARWGHLRLANERHRFGVSSTQIAANVTQFAGRATSPCRYLAANSFNKFMERPPRTGHQGSTATGGSITLGRSSVR